MGGTWVRRFQLQLSELPKVADRQRSIRFDLNTKWLGDDAVLMGSARGGYLR